MWTKQCSLNIFYNNTVYYGLYSHKYSYHSASTYMIGLFACVYSQVTLQCLQVAKTSATYFTWIWLLSSMNQNMSTKVSNL